MIGGMAGRWWAWQGDDGLCPTQVFTSEELIFSLLGVFREHSSKDSTYNMPHTTQVRR